jgi:7-cyano-7-deazaguanine synthase in queuosine biosynthesis
MSEKELVLVSCSGGLDSSITLCMLKLSGYSNILPVHFKYGHRGQLAEEMAIKNVCKELNLSLKIFDLQNLYKEIDVESISMLANKNSKIITGTSEGLKTTAAWHPARNLLFMNCMIALAEAEVMKHNYDKIYFAGGFLQLTESATYPDNTPYFADACLKAAQYGTLVGNRFKVLCCLSNLMKFEQFVLIKEFGLQNVYRHTISCDRPVVETPACDHTLINYISPESHDSVACNCMKNGIPACGSGLLSYWASKMVGMDDMKIRNFCEVYDPDYKAYMPEHLLKSFSKTSDINEIIDRILFPPDKLDNIRKMFLKINPLLKAHTNI